MSNSEGVSSDMMLELIEQFGKVDRDGNGYIVVSEISEFLKDATGENLPGYQIRDIIKSVDKDENGAISFKEFMALFTDMHGDPLREAILKRMSSSQGGASESGSGTIQQPETAAFANFFNRILKDVADAKTYLPIDGTTDDLFRKLQDGILLCKIINTSAPGTVDDRAMNKGKLNVFTKHENLTLALNSARAIGCCIVNIGAEDLAKGTPHLVLGLLWKIIYEGLVAKINLQNVPGLLRLLQQGEDFNDLIALSPEEVLIRWVNYHMEQAGSKRRIANFGEDIKDSEVYVLLLKQIAPRDVKLDNVELSSDSSITAEAMLKNADRMNCREFVSPKDVVKGYQKLNMAFVANLFNNYPALEATNEVPEGFEPISETREEMTFRNWMNSLGVPRVNHLYSDLRDGLVLLALMDIVQPGIVDHAHVNSSPQISGGKMSHNMKILENCNYVVELGKKMNFSMVGIGGEDIKNGNRTLTLAIVWQLMRAYILGLLSKLSDSAGPTISDQGLKDAVNKQLHQAGKAHHISGFKDPTIAGSLVVLELVDAIRSKSVNWGLVINSDTDEGKLANARYAVSMARKIGARCYAVPDDIVAVKPKMVLTVFASLMTVAFQK